MEQVSESAGPVWEALAQAAPGTCTTDDIVDATGLSPQEARKTLGLLVRAGAASCQPEPPEPPPPGGREYRARTDMDAMAWARAAWVGVPVDMLERHATLSRTARSMALRLASSGEVERTVAADRESLRDRGAAARRERAQGRLAATELARLVSDVEELVGSRDRRRLPPAERAALGILKETAREGRRYMEALVRNLSGITSANGGQPAPRPSISRPSTSRPSPPARAVQSGASSRPRATPAASGRAGDADGSAQ